MKYVITVMLVFYTGTTSLAGNIKKCVGVDGAVSYTDTQCAGQAGTQATILSDEDNNSKKSTLTQSSVSTNRLNAMMPGVRYLCEKRFGQHYLQGHPTLKRAPHLAFDRIEDRFIRRESVSIILTGNLSTKTPLKETEAPSYKCIAKKAKMLAEWDVKIEKIPPSTTINRTTLTTSTGP